MTTRFENEGDAITYIFRSLRKLRGIDRGLDEHSRDVSHTTRLLAAVGLPAGKREYAVVTGSKGKGSTTVITAKLLQHLGHRVGLMTSPHLVTFRERIRVNGQVIPEADFVRILSDLAPAIDSIEDTLTDAHYFSPQGIFLAIALQWFDEQDVNAAVLEVGRGGRFDDIAVVPNKLSLFTPIMLEHTQYLGDSVERIAWHKSGIIKPYSTAYSVPQSPEVLQVLLKEAETKKADFTWLAQRDMGAYVADTPDGVVMNLHRYGDVEVSLMGRYQVMNATLAVQGAGNMHSRLAGIAHASPEYVERIRAGLRDIRWPGRCQKLQDKPQVYLDGAINGESAASLVESLRGRLTQPVVSIVCVPDDKDYEGVYRELGAVSQSLILYDTARNPTLHFLPADTAQAIASRYTNSASHFTDLRAAVDSGLAQVGQDGTLLIVGTQSLLADTTLLWGYSYETI